ncbi:hypothetical protein GCM10009087_51870 [Sphingomonas oligophenolica]|uniref:Peptidase S1 domain-containing protein n=1 Tax=Sphingomonas oligophenolica TaxID=301154 RepID=A0ABU9Y6T2_9SPHN
MGKAIGKHIWAAIAAVLAMSAGGASAQSPGAAVAPPPLVTAHVQTGDEALAQDAGEYARLYAVPIDEAMRRLRAQEETVATTDRLQDLYGDRLAGLYIEHRPAYRIVVLLTGSDPVPDQTVFAGGMTVPIVFRTGAPASRTRILGAITQHQAEIRAAVPHPPSMGVDPRTGQLVLMVDGADIDRIGQDALKARIEAIAKVPVRIRVQDRPEVNLEDVNLVGGGGRVEGMNPADGKRYACTSGFVVTDGARDGVVTAAHCPDTLAYYGPDRSQLPLQFLGQWGWGYQDVQLHVSEQALQPLFYADTRKTMARTVTGARNRTSTRVGDVVCHRGERTGYSCAEVELVDFAPSGDLCGGACLATWVAVAGPNCKGGDSGAPVFNGTTAFGLVKGASYRGDGSCIFYFYMSTDYLPAGWSLLESQVSSPVAPVLGEPVAR